jgi:hypothetical protein
VRYRIIGLTRAGAVGGIEPDANAALSKVVRLEGQGLKKIMVRDEREHLVTREELVRRARADRGFLDP